MEENYLYHVYNRGNNKQSIFYNEANYLFFLKKVRTHLYPCCDILAYCLMPNHFHFLIHANENSLPLKNNGIKKIHAFSENLRILLSSYTRAINKQENRSGSLFQQNTKIKPLNDIYYGKISKSDELSYAYYCFHYIHNNPVEANIVTNSKDWKYSSYLDYAGVRNGTLINKKIALQYIDLEDKYYTKNKYSFQY